MKQHFTGWMIAMIVSCFFMVSFFMAVPSEWVHPAKTRGNPGKNCPKEFGMRRGTAEEAEYLINLKNILDG